MAKRFRNPDSNGTTAAASGCKTVFVATSLDTHMAMTLSFSDTVADFKRKIMLQHDQCFPGIGALIIHYLKVKYRGHYYHLHESDMRVSSAFEGYDGRWSLFVDASSSLEDVKEQRFLDPCDNCELESVRVPQEIQAITWKSPGESSGMNGGHVHGTCRVDFSSLISRNMVGNIPRSNDDDKNEIVHSDNPDEPRSEIGLTAKKKQKIELCVQVASVSALSTDRTSPQATTRHRSYDESAGIEDSFVDAGQKGLSGMQIGGDCPYDTSYSGMNVLSGTVNTLQSELATEKSHLFEKEAAHGHHGDLSIRTKVSDMENIAPEKSAVDGRENVTYSNVPVQQLQEEHPVTGASIKKGKKKRKKEQQGTNSYAPDSQAATSKSGTLSRRSVLQEVYAVQTVVAANHGTTEDDESTLAPTGNGQNDIIQEGRLSSNHDVQLIASVKPSDQEIAIMNQESVLSQGIFGRNKSAEADISGGSKNKRKKVKKSAVQKQVESAIMNSPSRTSVSAQGAAPTAHSEDDTKRDESNLAENDSYKSAKNSELGANHVLEVTCLEGNKCLDSGEANLDKQNSASAAASDVRVDLEAGKSGSSQRKKKGKKSAAKNNYPVVEYTKDANDPLAGNDSPSKDFAAETIADQSILSCIKGKEGSKTASATDFHKKDRIVSHDDKYWDLNSGKESNNNLSRDRATVEDQLNMEQATDAQSLPMDQGYGKVERDGTTKKKKKKKAKKNENSAGEGLGVSEINQKHIGDEELASSVEKLGDVDHADTLKVSGSDEKRTIEQSGLSCLGPAKNHDLKGSGKLEQLQQHEDDSPEVPPYEIENNRKARLAAVTNMANNALASEGENDSINFKDYFVPIENLVSTEKAEKESNVVESEKADEHEVVPEGKRMPSKAQRNQKKSSSKKADNMKHANSSSKLEQEKDVVEKEISTNSRKASKVPNSSDGVKVKTLGKSVEPAVVNRSDSTMTVTPQLEKNDESLTSSNFNLSIRGFRKVVQSKNSWKEHRDFDNNSAAEGKVSRKKNRDPGNGSQEKSLLTIPGAIFGDVSSESSGDENAIGKSGSATHSSSDNSFSSGDSTSEGGSKSTLSPKVSDARNIPIDVILRSSSRFKKAKITASQSEAADIESQAVDFVPESQPLN